MRNKKLKYCLNERGFIELSQLICLHTDAPRHCFVHRQRLKFKLKDYGFHV